MCIIILEVLANRRKQEKEELQGIKRKKLKSQYLQSIQLTIEKIENLIREFNKNGQLSHIPPFATPWTIQSTEFSRKEYWSGQPVPSPGDLPRQILYPLSHQGSPRILECVAYPFSRASSRPRNQTGVSCIAGGFFTG